MKPLSFRIAVDDNVATLLQDSGQGERVAVTGEGPVDGVVLNQDIRCGHKVALRDIPQGDPVVKYGIPIGRARQTIRPGDWVHLHNCESYLDERSSSLDLDTGAPQDIAYE